MGPAYVLLVVIVTGLACGAFGYWLSEISHDGEGGDIAV